ncbi:MAG: adenosine kinase [Inquilinus limosus]|uniref:Adenosine kinase n=1 Tax=Inquilinus limosus TaxID=171674 RepID=A0A952FPB8_9PROT|nr:adenosine kinase [Inquilinus limosus]
MSARYDATCIGNAIVDVITKNEEAFIAKHGLVKGAMTLIDAERAEALYAAMGPGLEASGGSAGNTAAGLASLGGKAAFIGKVTADQLGAVYRHDIRAVGVDFDSKPLDPAAPGTPPTARSLIIVTPDAQRTMNTYLGACVELTPDDVDEAVISGSQVTYLEGYLWDRPTAKEAFIKAAQIAHSAGRKVSLTLSDSFCVERHRDSFLSLIDSHVDLLFANEAEIKALYQVDDFDTAVATVRGRCEVAAITRSEKGSVIVTEGETHLVEAAPLVQLVDTTGAGDLYASGFLYGFTRGLGLAESGRIGSIAAAEVISHVGPRPLVPLRSLIG